MAEMQIHTFLIGLMIFSLVVIFGSTMLADINTTYATVTDYRAMNYSGTLGKGNYSMIDQTAGMVISMKNSTFESNLKEDSILDSMIKGVIIAIRTITSAFSLMFGVIGSLIEDLRLPPIFGIVAAVAATVTLLIAIYRFIFRAI